MIGRQTAIDLATWAKDRLSERSTIAGVLTLATTSGSFSFSPETKEAIITICAVVASLVAIWIREKSTNSIQEKNDVGNSGPDANNHGRAG